MLVFNEGVPRAGKSYDAVANHILPALRKRRRVYVRLNGLDHDKIADHLKMSRDDVRDLLRIVDTKDVVKTFSCFKDEVTGEWRIADDFKNSLVVVDEVHEFYVAERIVLPPQVENFWALLGQNGGDAVIMTQWINRLHSAVKARIEKKNSFQKLSAVGMDGSYRVTYYQTTSPGKFEKIGAETKKYDSAIYPLYHGYAPGAENTEVYKEGGTNVWRSLALKGAIYLVIAIFGVWGFASFFMGGGKGVAKGDDSAVLVGPTAAPQIRPVTTTLREVVVAENPLKDMTPEQRYVAEISGKGRVRLAMLAEMGGKQFGVVEWVDSSGNTIESLTFNALVALGYRMRLGDYGVTLVAHDYSIVVTPWPREAPRREPDARLYRLDNAGPTDVASAASDGGGAGNGSVLVRGNPSMIAGIEP